MSVLSNIKVKYHLYIEKSRHSCVYNGDVSKYEHNLLEQIGDKLVKFVNEHNIKYFLRIDYSGHFDFESNQYLLPFKIYLLNSFECLLGEFELVYMKQSLDELINNIMDKILFYLTDASIYLKLII